MTKKFLAKPVIILKPPIKKSANNPIEDFIPFDDVAFIAKATQTIAMTKKNIVICKKSSA